jgi:hypothetical protein
LSGLNDCINTSFYYYFERVLSEALSCSVFRDCAGDDFEPYKADECNSVKCQEIQYNISCPHVNQVIIIPDFYSDLPPD